MFRNEFLVERMAKVLDITRDSYYKWLKRKQSKRKQKNEFLLSRIRYIFYLHEKRYGSSRIHAELKKENITCSRRRVAKLMKSANLVSVRYKRHRYPENKNSEKIDKYPPNLLNQNFTVDSPNNVWVSDITYIPTKEGWLYLTTIIDLFNREVVGESRSYNLKTENTVIKALYGAMRKRKPKENLIFHSDRGVQYHSEAFKKTLKAFNITQSASGKGNCYDNAVAESFFKTLKSELLSNGTFKTRREAKIKVFEYIELYYNKKRIHSSLNWLTPEEYLENYYKNTGKIEEKTRKIEQKEAI